MADPNCKVCGGSGLRTDKSGFQYGCACLGPRPGELIPCPFCEGPPVVCLDKSESSFKPTEDGEYLEGYVFCHECGAEGPTRGHVCVELADIAELRNKTREAWNLRDNRHRALYEINREPAAHNHPTGGQFDFKRIDCPACK